MGEKKRNRIADFGATLRHETPQGLILDLGGCPQSSMEGRSQELLLDFLGLPKPDFPRLLFGQTPRLEESLLKELDIDTRSVGGILRPQDSPFQTLGDDRYIDEWGIQRRFTGLYWDVVDPPLAGATLADLERYPFPDGASVNGVEIDRIARRAKALHDAGEYVVCAEHPVYGVFELGCWLCGFEDFLLRVMEDEAFVHRLFEIILNYQKQVIERYYRALGPYLHYTTSGDDFAMQTNLFMPPHHFRELIKPYLQERIACTKQYTNAPFLHHSCGNVFKLIPDLIDAGVDILNPIQPVGAEMAPENLKEQFGERIVLHGGIDTQQLLPGGTQDSIEEAVAQAIATLGRGGGYIFAAAHNIQEDVPPANVVHLFRAARRFGG